MPMARFSYVLASKVQVMVSSEQRDELLPAPRRNLELRYDSAFHSGVGDRLFIPCWKWLLGILYAVM